MVAKTIAKNLLFIHKLTDYSLESSRRRVSILVIVFFACDFGGPGKT